MWPPFLHPLKKGLSPLVSSKTECTWTLIRKKSLLICFENCQSIPYLHRQIRKKMMNTFIIVNIIPIRKKWLENKSMLAPPERSFLLPSVWPGREYDWALIWKEVLQICFESYQGIPYSHKHIRNRMVNTMLMVNVTPKCKR